MRLVSMLAHALLAILALGQTPATAVAPAQTIARAQTVDLALARQALSAAREALEQHRIDSAHQALERALAAFGPASTALAGADEQQLADFGEAQCAQRDTLASRPVWERLLAARAAAGLTEDARSCGWRTKLGAICLQTGDLARARQEMERVVAYRTSTLAEDDPELQFARGGLGTVLARAGDLKAARELQQSALAVLERKLGEASRTTIKIRNGLANTFLRLGSVPEARKLYERNLALLDQAGEDDPDRTMTCRNLAAALSELGDLRGARAMEERIVAIYERTLAADDLDLARARLNLAVSMEQFGETEAALERLQQVTPVFEHALPPDDSDRLLGEQQLGLCYRRLARLGEAQVLLEDVLARRLRLLPDYHIDIQRARVNLGGTLKELGDLGAARTLLEQACAGMQATLPPEHIDLQRARQVLSNVLDELGDRDGAMALIEQALAAREAIAPEDDPELANSRMALALQLMEGEDPQRACELAHRVLEQRTRALPPDSLDLVLTRLNVETLELIDGSSATSVEELRATHAALVQRLGPEHLYTRLARETLAVALALGPEPRAARALIEAHVASCASRSRPGDPELVSGRAELAWLLARLGEREALESVIEALANDLRSGAIDPLVCARREIAERAAAFMPSFKQLFALPVQDPHAQRVTLGFEAVESLRAGTCAPLPTGADSSATRAQAERLRELRRALNDLVAGTPERTMSSDDKVLRMGEIVRERDTLERGLRDASASGTRTRAVEMAALARALPPGALAAGFFEWQAPDARKSPFGYEERVLVHVLGHDGALARIDLGTAAELRAAAADWRAAIGKPIDGSLHSGSTAANAELERKAGERLRQLVLDPILACAGKVRELSELRELYVCLDDALWLTPLDALPLDGGIVGERYAVHVLPSFATLIERQATTSGDATLLLAGGIDFDAGASSAYLPLASAAPPLSFERGAATASEAADSHAGPAGSLWGPLLETRAEVTKLAELFHDTFARDAVVLTGKDATKRAVYDRSGGARFVHLATHGYFAPQSVRSSADPRAHFDQRVSGLAPMTLCGLAFAGANSGADALGRVPGVLTAEELSGFDLSHCELAVLSACETNVGITRAGQGIQSLQAALHAAGARTAITSLWKVDDEKTRALFVDFYTRIWVKKETKAQALWHAKMALRQSRAATRDWAGWILTGAPD